MPSEPSPGDCGRRPQESGEPPPAPEAQGPLSVPPAGGAEGIGEGQSGAGRDYGKGQPGPWGEDSPGPLAAPEAPEAAPEAPGSLSRGSEAAQPLPPSPHLAARGLLLAGVLRMRDEVRTPPLLPGSSHTHPRGVGEGRKSEALPNTPAGKHRQRHPNPSTGVPHPPQGILGAAPSSAEAPAPAPHSPQPAGRPDAAESPVPGGKGRVRQALHTMARPTV